MNCDYKYYITHFGISDPGPCYTVRFWRYRLFIFFQKKNRFYEVLLINIPSKNRYIRELY